MNHQEIGKIYIAFIWYTFEKMQCDLEPAKKIKVNCRFLR